MSVVHSEKSEPVDLAQKWAERLLRAESTRTGLTVRQSAERVARKLKSSPSALLALLYAPPKDIGTRFFETLRAAVEREINSDIEALQNELAAARGRRLDAGHGEIAQIEADLERLLARLKGRP